MIKIDEKSCMKFLKENQNKSMIITIMNNELTIEKHLEQGYSLEIDEEMYSLVDNNNNEDKINLFLFDYKDDVVVTFEFSTNKEVNKFNADAELSIDNHFTMFFYLDDEDNN